MTADYDIALDDIDEAFLDLPEPPEDAAEESAESVDPGFIEEKKITPRARRYSEKTRRGLNFAIKATAGNPATVHDSATLLYHGKDLSNAVGQLADADDKVRKAIDFITDDTIENPYILTALAILPILFQVARNHQTALETPKKVARIRIPFTKRYIPLKFSFKIRIPFLANVSVQPNYLTQHVYGNPAIKEKLQAQGVHIAWPPVDPRQNGHR